MAYSNLLRRGGQKPIGYQALTVSTSVVTLTVPAGANACVITVETATVRYRSDGTDPTSTTGAILFQNASAVFKGIALMKALEFIRISTAAGDATLLINYYGE
jgi:hypothetical protein